MLRLGLITTTTVTLLFLGCGLGQAADPKRVSNLSQEEASGEKKTKEQKEAERKALAVADIMTTFCYPCHGENGSSEGGFDYADDLGKLANSPLVVQGEADDSKLYTRVHSGQMPPSSFGKTPSKAEIEAIKDWIEDGATVVETRGRMITPTEIKKLIETDFGAIPEEERSGVAYFDLSHIYSGSSIGHANEVRNAFSKLVNSVSNAEKIIKPLALNAEKTVYKIELKDFGWEVENFNQLRAMNPFPLEGFQGQQVINFPRGGIGVDDQEKIFQNQTNNQQPTNTPVSQALYFRADWFVKTASKAPFYYQLLGTPSQLFLLEEKIGLDTVANLKAGNVVRAGFANSQVASHQRIIERHASPNGSLWKSFEFGSSQVNKNIFQSPLGPGTVFAEDTDKRFVQDGHELIYHLKNGMLGFAIFNGDGNRLDQAPSGQNDGIKENSTITAGVSCMSCHKAGLIDKEDQVAESVSTFEGLFSEIEKELVSMLYKDADTITEIIEKDSERYKDALDKLGIDPEHDDPVSTTARRYSAPMGFSEAAAYLGMTASALSDLAKGNENLKQTLYGAIAGNSMDRQFWEQNFARIRQIVENPTLNQSLPNPINPIGFPSADGQLPKR